MKKSTISSIGLILIAVSFICFGLIYKSSELEKVTEENTATGIQEISAEVKVYTTMPMIDTIVITYQDDVSLPEKSPEAYFSFVDYADESGERVISKVYTNNHAEKREDRNSIEGRYVIIELQEIENIDGSIEWHPETSAGSAIRWNSSSSERRIDYSEIRISQNYDLLNNDGEIVQKSGTLPELKFNHIEWPEFEDFTFDEVLNGETGEIHYSYYIPENYDKTKQYPMMVVLPGYDGLLHSNGEETLGMNVYANRSALEWTRQNEDMIVLAPQLRDWQDTSARQTIELVEYILKQYSIDPDRVYASGYSAGGETMSRVMAIRADLFAAYLHGSSQWDGSYDVTVNNRVPVYVFMAENDEYYGSEKAIEVYDTLHDRYLKEGLTETEISDLVHLNLPDNEYFNRQGIYNYHSGGQLAVNDKSITEWVLSK